MWAVLFTVFDHALDSGKVTRGIGNILSAIVRMQVEIELALLGCLNPVSDGSNRHMMCVGEVGVLEIQPAFCSIPFTKLWLHVSALRDNIVGKQLLNPYNSHTVTYRNIPIVFVQAYS